MPPPTKVISDSTPTPDMLELELVRLSELGQAQKHEKKFLIFFFFLKKMSKNLSTSSSRLFKDREKFFDLFAFGEDE